MAYLLKVTIIWSIFLVLFELMYKNNARFSANRFYLLLSITLGLLLPVIPWPYSTQISIAHTPAFYPVLKNISTIPQQSTTSVLPGTATVSGLWDTVRIAGLIYVTGVLILCLKYSSELYKIVLLLRKKTVQVYHDHKVINTGKIHSPFSFLNYIFLTNAASLHPEELEYIIRHEAAHHKRKHWLDLWLLQLVNIIFWFHPLVWRYRYLLRLQHEYEADAMAASDNPYTYGRFLLQQTLLRGVPSITHSLHFSPIKNRITMLTKIDSAKTNYQKYLLLVPALLACTFLMAKSNTGTEGEMPGNKMSFKGNILTFRQSDTLFYDKEKGRAELVPANARVKPQIVVGINSEPVYRNDYLQAQASFGNNSMAFSDYIKEEFQRRRKDTPDSLTYLIDLNVVVSKDGKVVYYDAHYARPEEVPGQPRVHEMFYNWYTGANDILDKIIADSPLWKPASNKGTPVNSYLTVRFPGC